MRLLCLSILNRYFVTRCLVPKPTKRSKEPTCPTRLLSGDTRNSIKMAAKLRLVQIQTKAGGEIKVGVQLQDNGSVVDITSLDASIPLDMKSFLEGGEENMQAAVRYVFI